MNRGNRQGKKREKACWAQQRQKDREAEMERESFKTKVMACCDKHWFKSLSKSDTTGAAESVSLFSPTHKQN